MLPSQTHLGPPARPPASRLTRFRSFVRSHCNSSPADIHYLAPETLCTIFELAHDPKEPSTMCSAALVCRTWKDPAQRALFQDIH